MSLIERCSHTQARTVFDKVTHKIEISWNQVWTGTNQERFIEVKDDQLKIKTATIISPVSGKKSIHTLAWQRVKMTHSDDHAYASTLWLARFSYGFLNSETTCAR
jgi:hypothetical protein